MKDLIKRKNDEKKEIIRLIGSCKDIDTLNKALQTYQELETFDLFDPVQDVINTDTISMYDHTIDSDFFKFAFNVIDIMSSMPLLETESFIQYPTLRSTKKISDKELRDFWNQIFRQETNHTLFTKDNTIFIRPSFIEKLSSSNGKFAVYNNYATEAKTLILNRSETTRDFINPYFIQMSDYIKKGNYRNILGYFMQGRSIQSLNKRDCSDLLYTYYDRLVYTARRLRRYSDPNALSAVKKIEIINYVDEIIGLLLSEEAYTLNDLAIFDSILDVNKTCYTDTITALEIQEEKMKKIAIKQKR